MIIIDKDQEIEAFLGSREELGLSSVRIDTVTYEYANGLAEDLAVVHAENLKGASALFMSKLEKQKAIAVFGDLDSDDFPKNCVLTIQKENNEKQVCSQLLRIENILKEFMTLKSQLLTINRELEDTMGSVETELIRVKRAHEQNRPKRFQDLKGLKALSKYAAGDSVGGEFFDIFTSQGKIFLMMSETSSYLASSSILQIFADFKEKKDLGQKAEIDFLNEIKTEVQEINKSKKKKPLTVNMLTAILDLNTYEARGHVFGEFKLVSSRQKLNFAGNKLNFLEDKFEDALYTRSLDRGERLLILSPGFVKNWEELSPELMIESLLNNKKIKLLDVLDEVFFQLKKDSKGGFLAYDASAIMLEVQKNVMLQI